MFKKRKHFLVFGSPLIEEKEIQEVVDTLRSGWLGTVPKVARFNRKRKMGRDFRSLFYQ
jgi:dTDP-4-amino-4,6-dideoxygalactose transaminase